MTKYYITGNTYPAKNVLKELGCKWVGELKAWITEDEDVVRKLRMGVSYFGGGRGKLVAGLTITEGKTQEMRAREHDALYNEGADGYNHYPNHLQQPPRFGGVWILIKFSPGRVGRESQNNVAPSGAWRNYDVLLDRK